jgi:hypothetical protein
MAEIVNSKIISCAQNAKSTGIFMPYGCHNLNPVLYDAAKSSAKSFTLFRALGRLYSPFAASVNRWDILTDQVKSFTLERLSDTWWEAKIASEKAIRYQIGDVHYAIIIHSCRERGNTQPLHCS